MTGCGAALQNGNMPGRLRRQRQVANTSSAPGWAPAGQAGVPRSTCRWQRGPVTSTSVASSRRRGGAATLRRCAPKIEGTRTLPRQAVHCCRSGAAQSSSSVWGARAAGAILMHLYDVAVPHVRWPGSGGALTFTCRRLRYDAGEEVVPFGLLATKIWRHRFGRT